MFAAANRTKPELAAVVTVGAEKAGVAGITWALEAMARRPDRSGVLARLTIPVLIVHGVEDQFIPVERARALAERMPGALYLEISGAGHCSPLETPEIVAKGLSELTARVESAAR
jgi:pimeloyl-ACP methyl ester carboxylesterase